MKISPFNNSNFRVISEDKQTVKNQYDCITFSIYHREFEIAKITMSIKCVVSDLMASLRHKLSLNKKFPI